MIYQYWVVRYVPNIARGEFTNIGLVCGTDGADWAARFDLRGVPNTGALSADLRELASWIRWFQRRVDTFSAGTLEGDRIDIGWMQHLRTRQANAVQFSEATPMDAYSAQDGVDLLFPHLVERTHTTRSRRGLSRANMRTELRDTFQHELGYRLGDNLFRAPKMRVGQWPATFDLGRRETDQTVLTNVWAFNVSTREYLERDIASWNYAVTRFRRDGGDVTLDRSEQRLTGHERIEVVFDPPERRDNDSWRDNLLNAAQESWEREGVVAAPFDDYLANLRGSEFAMH